MINKDYLEKIASKLSGYKEGEEEAKESLAIYSGFVQTFEGSFGLYAATMNPKTHNPLGVIGHYLTRKDLKSNAEELKGKLGSGLLIKHGDKEYNIGSEDFGDVVELLNESHANIGRLFNMYYLQLEELFEGSPIFNEMSGAYKGKY